MKSVFEEGSTIFDAIEKAWKKANGPDNFTIKIINCGKKGFLGLWSKPAIVSLSYKFRKDSNQFVSKKGSNLEFVQRKVLTQTIRKDVRSTGAVFDSKDAAFKENISRKTKALVWNDEFIREISQYLNKLFCIMKINIPFKVNINNKILNVNLEKSILFSKDEEKSFYISLSHILMQFLKKRYKKKFEGFHIIINSPLVVNDSKQN